MSSTLFWFWLPALSPWKSEHVSQSCPTLCNPKDCSSSVHGILQARILEWVAIPFFRESSWPRDQTQVSLIAGRFFTIWATRKPAFSTRILSGRGGFLGCLRTVSTFPPPLLSPHPSVPRDLTGLSSYNPCYPLSKLICCLMKKWWSMASPTSRILKASSMSTHPGRAKEGPKRPRHLSPALYSSLTAPSLRKGSNKASLWGVRDMMGVNARGQWNFILEMQTPPWGIQGQAGCMWVSSWMCPPPPWTPCLVWSLLSKGRKPHPLPGQAPPTCSIHFPVPPILGPCRTTWFGAWCWTASAAWASGLRKRVQATARWVTPHLRASPHMPNLACHLSLYDTDHLPWAKHQSPPWGQSHNWG